MENKKVILGQFYTSEKVAKFMLSLITKDKKAKVLESGFGSGVFLKCLTEEGFSNITGYDIDEENYVNARKTFGDSIKLVHQDYLKSPIDDKYDVIIGNPPYVSWNRILPEVRANLANNVFWRLYSNGEWDLLYAFIIWSIEKLNENGELIYIVPFNWFNATYAASLRDYLISNGVFEVINHFGEYKLFADCAPNNIIFRYRKETKNNSHQKSIFISDFYGKKGDISEILNTIQINQKTMIDINSFFEDETKTLKIYHSQQFSKGKAWYLGSPRDKIFTEMIEGKTQKVTLGDYFHVAVGLVSGFDNAFKIDDQFYQQLLTKEKDLVKPFVKASNCGEYVTNGTENYIFTENINSEEELNNYPTIKNHLEKYKQDLLARYMSKSKPWWKWATIRNFEIHKKYEHKSKIFVPCMDRSKISRFGISLNLGWGAGDVLSISSKSDDSNFIFYCLAWLNSDFINKWYRIKGAKSGHRIKYTQAYVSKIPFLLPNEKKANENELYNQIVKNTKFILTQNNFNLLRETNDRLFTDLLNEK